MDIILASQSPRRRDLLKKIVPEFRVVPSRVDEENFRENDPVRFSLRAAEAKAKDVGEKHPAFLIIAADTLVCLGDEIFGKPETRDHAKEMLEKLSGRRHRVITAVALFKKDEEKLLIGWETSFVEFKRLGQKEIEDYLARSDYFDKAGSYAIQEIGDAFVEKLEGEYDNVVGLPVKKLKRLLAEFLAPEIVIPITDMALPHDWGVGTAGRLVTFVPGAVVGDKVRIKTAAKKKRHQFGRLVGIEEPSPFRVAPECPHFGACGGCAFQNLAYAKQLEIKETYLLQTLSKIGRVDINNLEREPMTPSPSVYGYRNKMEYAFGGEGGDVFLGLRQRASPLERYKKRTIPLRKCPIFSSAVEAIFPVFIDFAKSTGLPAYLPLTHQGILRNLVLREGKSTGEVMAVLVTKRREELDFGRLGEKLKGGLPRVKSFWWVENERISDVVDFAKKTHLSGRAFIEEKLGALIFRIYPESFFQPNPKAAEILYGRIVSETKNLGSRRVLGLYCGPGAIEIFLSRAASEVVGIDSEPMNIRTAEENCAINGIDNCRFVQGRVEEILKAHHFEGFDLLVIDPPRAGISGKGLKQIMALNIPAIIYVSCNPAAFARDVSLLVEKGYSLRKLHSFDFFPHTPHLESLAILAK